MAIGPLLVIRQRLIDEIAATGGRRVATARQDGPCRRPMAIPGVGPLTARTFLSVIDDPARLRSSQLAGAHLGLAPRRRQSGEVGRSGHITRCGDGMLRHLRYGCASNVPAILKRPSPLKDWAGRLQARIGARKTRVALAGNLAVPMRRLWSTGGTYAVSGPKTA